MPIVYLFDFPESIINLMPKPKADDVPKPDGDLSQFSLSDE